MKTGIVVLGSEKINVKRKKKDKWSTKATSITNFSYTYYFITYAWMDVKNSLLSYYSLSDI